MQRKKHLQYNKRSLLRQVVSPLRRAGLHELRRRPNSLEHRLPLRPVVSGVELHGPDFHRLSPGWSAARDTGQEGRRRFGSRGQVVSVVPAERRAARRREEDKEAGVGGGGEAMPAAKVQQMYVHPNYQTLSGQRGQTRAEPSRTTVHSNYFWPTSSREPNQEAGNKYRSLGTAPSADMDAHAQLDS